MAKFNYDRAQKTANRLIDKFGSDRTLIRITNGGVEWDPTPSETSYDCVGAVMAYETDQIDGTRIQSSDKRVLISVGDLAIEPTPDDKIKLDSVEHEIISVMPLKPAETVVYWELQCRD